MIRGGQVYPSERIKIIINTKLLTKNSFIKTSISYTSNRIKDDLYEKNIISVNGGGNSYDSIGDSQQMFKSKAVNSKYIAALTYSNKINVKNKIQAGAKYILNSVDYKQDTYMNDFNDLINVADFNNQLNTLSTFFSWKYSINDKISIVSGFHNMNVFFNNKNTFEPRIALNWKFNNTSSINLGYGKHSTSEKPQNYFTKILQADGSYIEPNKNLDLLKADHFVFGYKKHFTEYLVAKIELYYQKLYNISVENNDTSYYSTLNESTDYRYVDLINKGVGKNYGVELTLERFFANNFYFVINGSLYNSKYKSLEGVWRNTMYNGNYMVNFLCGKEFKDLGRKKNKTLALNIKSYVGGSQRYIPLLRDENGNVAIDLENNKYWDYEKAYNNDLVHVYNVNVSVSYKINKSNSTHEIFLDLMNMIHSDAHLSEHYDESQPGNVGYEKQMIFLPNIMYRVYF